MNERIGTEKEYIIREDGTVVIKKTGEIIDIETLLLVRQNDLLDEYKELKEDAQEAGLSLDVRVSTYNNKKYEYVPVKSELKYGFNKIFRKIVSEIMEDSNLDNGCLAFIARFSPLIIFPYNYVQIDKKFPTMELMASKVNIERRKLYEILNILEKHEFIKREKHGKSSIIYFNPFLYSTGPKIALSTYKLFENSSYNPHK